MLIWTFWECMPNIYFSYFGMIFVVIAYCIEIIMHLVGHATFIVINYKYYPPYFSVVNNLIGSIVVTTIILVLYAPIRVWDQIKIQRNDTT